MVNIVARKAEEVFVREFFPQLFGTPIEVETLPDDSIDRLADVVWRELQTRNPEQNIELKIDFVVSDKEAVPSVRHGQARDASGRFASSAATAAPVLLRNHRVPSRSKPGTFHTVQVDPQGVAQTCSCLGFENRGTCAHVKRLY